jgi:NADPH:quinone reductase-like Zn-dependent oxidoreductase
MKALQLIGYGGPTKVEFREIAVPAPGPQQVLVRIHAAALNPVDYKFRQGILLPIIRPKLPVTLGNDFCGVIESLGSSVAGLNVGQRVYGCAGIDHTGTLAEYAVVPVERLAIAPENLSPTQAAGIPLAAQTALQTLRDVLRVKPGQRVLISGGAGGVGTFAIPIAKLFGVYVTTTASSKGRELCLQLGADEVLDYHDASSLAKEGNFDAALDLVGGATTAKMFPTLKRGATLVSIAATPEPTTASDLQAGLGLKLLFGAISLPLRTRAKWHGVRYRYYFMSSRKADLEWLAVQCRERKLTSVIDREFSFAEVKEAFAYLEQGRAKGKVVVRISDKQ